MKHWSMLFAAGLIAITGSTAAQAFEQSKVQAVKDGQKSCLWCDLNGADFTKISLSGTDLSGADLTGANLTGVKFRNVDLTGADLTGAILRNADLTGTNLKGADLDQVDLSTAILVDAKLETANCDWATKFPRGSGLTCAGVTVMRK